MAVRGRLKIAIGSLLATALFVFLYFSFSGRITPDPILVSFGSISIRWYGALIAGAIYLSYLIISKRYERIVGKGNFELIFFLVLFLGLLGARFGFAIQNWPYFSQNPVDFFKIFQGGLSIHGGIIGGILGLAIATQLQKLNFLQIANIMSPEVLLSIAIGRFGNFFNQEIIGRPTNWIIKMYVQPENRPIGLESNSFYHPVFLYESILLASIYIYLAQKPERISKYGIVYLLVGYCFVRILVEFFRIDYRPILSIFDLAQLVSFGIILITLAITLTFRKK